MKFYVVVEVKEIHKFEVEASSVSEAIEKAEYKVIYDTEHSTLDSYESFVRFVDPVEE